MLIDCLHISAHLEQIGADLSQGTSERESWQNGYSNDHQEEPSINSPESVVDPHKQLLMILSNIGYCKDELASELYNKYKYTWLQFRWVPFLFDLIGAFYKIKIVLSLLKPAEKLDQLSHSYLSQPR